MHVKYILPICDKEIITLEQNSMQIKEKKKYDSKNHNNTDHLPDFKWMAFTSEWVNNSKTWSN